MRLVVVLLVVAAASAADVEWWKTALVYQIYPRSYMDSNGDGIGDLNGITEKLPYLKKTGVDAIWLSPIFLSPMYDFGYDITDYREIAPEYGTMNDFKNLMARAKELDLRILLDFVPNHTSNESDWFNRSIRREPGYEDYYVWSDGIVDPNDSSKTLPPNNWVSVFRKSAWEWNSERGQYYLHQFVIGQPDLNYRSDKLQQEMKDVLRFWLDQGVSGFRVDAVNHMYEADPAQYGGQYPNEPLSDSFVRHVFSGADGYGPDDYEYLNHIYTTNMEETYSVVYDWRDLLDEYIEKDGEYKILMTEAYAGLQNMIRYYGTESRNGSIPFNFSFLGQITKDSNAWDIKTAIDTWMTYMPISRTANWVNGNHDNSRMATRDGVDRVDAMNLLALILPGVAVTYQGEEIGMTDGEISWEDTMDPQACNTEDPVNYWKKSRDPCRTPFHWDGTTNAGFSTTNGKTWLPVADNYQEVNVENQMLAEKSHYKFYTDVAHARRSPAVRHGDLHTTALSESVLVVTRLLPGSPGMVAIVNLSDEEQHVNLSTLRLLPSDLSVIASGVACSIEKGAHLTKQHVHMSGHCAMLLQTRKRCC